jgi:aspartate ammonia-lyase
MSTRREHDLLGTAEVPAAAYYGIHTQRAAENFALSCQPIHRQLIVALAQVKKACAITNMKTEYLGESVGQAIARACDEIIAGSYHDQFITDALQGGAGTSMNLNACEVIANRAIELLGGQKGDYSLVHPLDHVNLSQSTNDVVPTAVKLASIVLLRHASTAFAELQAALQDKEREFAAVLKLGRTELMDAVPMTLGQEFAAWAQAVQRDWWRLSKCEERLRQVNLGGTAIGTGLNADQRYVFSVIEALRDVSGVGLARAENLIDATQNLDTFVEVSGMLKAAATNLAKIAADLRLLASGPRGGLGEIELPALQAGSSIMPGKVNPVVTEAASQVAFQVMAADLAITLGAAAGQLELNAFVPLVAHNLLGALDLLRAGAEMLARKGVAGIQANVARCNEHLERSLALVTALSPHIGYDAASTLAREAQQSGQSIRTLAVEKGLFSAAELTRILDTTEMTHPGIAGLRSMGVA